MNRSSPLKKKTKGTKRRGILKEENDDDEPGQEQQKSHSNKNKRGKLFFSLPPSNDGAPAAASVAATATLVLVGALNVFFQQDQSFLTAHELGRFSACCKQFQTLVEDNGGVWETVWRDVSEACGQQCHNDVDGGETRHLRRHCSCAHCTWEVSSSVLSGHGHNKVLLLGCFHRPDERVLARVGHKHAVRCLLSQHCFYCGCMAAGASPFSMTRMCGDCYEERQQEWLIHEERTKLLFLLNDDDCSALERVEMIGEEEPRLRLFLLCDVLAVCMAKFGGQERFEEEYVRLRLEERQRQQRFGWAEEEAVSFHPPPVSPPTYKLSSWKIDPVPIGTVDIHDTTKMSMSASCNICGADGHPLALALHVRLQHGISLNIDGVPEPRPTPTPSGPPLLPLSDLQVPTELRELFANNAVISYGYGAAIAPQEYQIEGLNEEDFRRFPSLMVLENVRSCTIRFSDTGVKIAVDFFFRFAPHRRAAGGTGAFTIACQLGPKRVPFVLLDMGRVMGDAEAPGRLFASLLAALGLHHTTPSQLLAALISRSMPVRDFLDVFFKDGGARDGLEVEKMPACHGAHGLLLLQGAGSMVEEEEKKKV